MIEVLLFVAALFGVPWIIRALLPPPSGSLSSFLVAFVPAVWSPTMLAIVFIVAQAGVVGLNRELRTRLGYRSGAARWIVFAGLVPALAVVTAVFAARAAGAVAPFIASNALMQAIGLQIITGAVGEELGWRGFLLPRLGKVAGNIGAVWIMAVLWSLWHVPAFFDPTLPHYFMPMFIVLPFTTFFGVFMGFVFGRTGGSILATIAAHLAFNVMTALGGTSLTSLMFWGILAGIFGAIAIVITVRGHLQTQDLHPNPM